MESYFIFAIVLTVLYVIYYAVNIARDLYGKKENGKTDEEVFDLGLVDATEESISVSENETGFSIGSEKYDTEVEAVVTPVVQDSDAKQEETAHIRFERLKAKAEERMEDSVPYLSDPFTSEEMYKAMVSRGCPENRPELKWKPVKDKL
ncbi:hypothetical protein NXW34_12815 [Bacteroides thetaiotaomicron]|jgi:hypothetical protein|uniref:hypothetical protein n=1 Tax=Bacteroides thetaiotaomicron TaxID=818 RepID=UPI002162622B|nr:hypothetical protein [Bacteroides thetaiotaomicron]MCS2244113.1 hypothetical protein [Bacteroides thetaiotaomicron]UVP54170.1 hypothetical protein NXX57_12860 [Bacteroides thetaiotaomicron]